MPKFESVSQYRVYISTARQLLEKFVAYYALISDVFAATRSLILTPIRGPVTLLRGPGPTRGIGNSNTACLQTTCTSPYQSINGSSNFFF